MSYKKEGNRLVEPVKIESESETGEPLVFLCHTIKGRGSFGVVFEAVDQQTKDTVAIKKVLQDRRFKNRELEIMEALEHPNVVRLIHSFYSESDDEVYLNLVMEFIPETVYGMSRYYTKSKQQIPNVLVKTYMYQLFRSLGYIHSLGICHRDIKPQNLLLDPESGRVKLCDFGSAKALVRGKPNVSYICSRYYRAPELIFGARDYTTRIDLWSLGCVMAELFLGHPLFPGESGVDQLVEVIKVLGTPKAKEIKAMNENYTDFKFPVIKANPWNKVFNAFTPPEAMDLISVLLCYTPTDRLTPYQACAHPYFDEIRDKNTTLPEGKPLPVLFNFSRREVRNMTHDDITKLIPSHVKLPFDVDKVRASKPGDDEDEYGESE